MFTEVAAHGGGGFSSDLSFRDSQCVRFFITQVLGIMLEDGVQEVAKRLTGEGENQMVDEGSRLGLVGDFSGMVHTSSHVSRCKAEHREGKGCSFTLQYYSSTETLMTFLTLSLSHSLLKLKIMPIA